MGRGASVENRGAAFMLAGEAARLLGVGVQTLHYYEREQLIPTPQRTAGGYRQYNAEQIKRVDFIRKAQSLGLPLEEIREIVRLAEQGTCPCGRVERALSDKLKEIDQRLRELRSFRRELASVIQRSARLSAQSREADICSIVEDAVPVSTVRDLPRSRRMVRKPRRSAD